MTDYASMTDEQINELIATRLGYRFDSRGTGVFSHGKEHIEYCAYMPDGSIAKQSDGHGSSYEVWEPTIDETLRAINCDFSWSLNDAIGLIDKDIPFRLEYEAHSGWYAVFFVKDDMPIHAYASRPARAICEAWLKWKDSQNGK